MEETPSSERDDKEHADAGWLIDETNKQAEGAASPPEAPIAPDEAYEIVGVEPGEDREEAPEPVAPPIPVAPRPARPKGADDSPSRPATEPVAVDVVWTRWAEWGPDLLRLGALGLVTLFLLYLTLRSINFFLAFLVLVVAMAAFAVLSYPLAITMERPVRVTPEQAVRDFFGALSHSMPHYRRMWLLLSSAGRRSPEFDSFEDFRSYWMATLAALDQGVPVRFNPLVFEVEDFRSEKSGGLTAVDGTFTLNVLHRRPADRPARMYRVEMGLVKGPDRMWYLNKGTMPKA